MKAEAGAICRTPPRGNGVGLIGDARVAAVPATNVSLGMNTSEDGAWWSFQNTSADTNAVIRFGPAGVAAANAATDLVIAPGTTEEWWCHAVDDSNFSTAGAEVRYYRSSR